MDGYTDEIIRLLTERHNKLALEEKFKEIIA